MYLKSLEIHGFKSFADRVEFLFHRGVTAVVGPNGCGKSNVLDAIRWVLGEQSARALRGGEMSDVIFNGADQRKPLGLAEVTLTFAEAASALALPYEEVAVTRRLYRDGKSEYLLNRTACRLRDIHTLFMDTGIGRSSYSIMEQGRIDQILSSHPEDRRAIFEEAAGVTKFKSRRKEALRRLDDTEGNLARLDDTIREVRRQLGSLQRQAAKAEKFLVLSRHRVVLDTHIGKIRLLALDTELESCLSHANALRSRLDAILSALETTESALVAERALLEESEEKLAATRQTALDCRSRRDAAQTRLTANARRREELDAQSARWQTEIAAADEREAVQQSLLEVVATQLHEAEASAVALKAELDARHRAVSVRQKERAESETRLRDLAAQAQRVEQDLAALHTAEARSLSQQESAESRRAQIAADLAALESELLALRSRDDALSNEEKLASAQADALRSALAATESQSAAARATLREKENASVDTQKALARTASRREALVLLDQQGEGMAEGVKFLLRDSRSASKLDGSLATRLQAPAHLALALEAALGPAFQSLLLLDPDSAPALLDTLRRQKKGRVTLALRIPASSASDPLPPALPASAAWLLPQLTVTEDVAPLVSRLLANIVLVPDVPAALALRAEFPDLACVTPSGEFFSAHGLLTGGQENLAAQAVFHRKAEIANLSAEETKLKTDTENEAAAIAALRAELADQDTARAEAEKAHQSARLACSTLRGQREQLSREIASQIRRLETLRSEIEKLETQRTEADATLEKLRHNLASATRILENLRAEEAQVQTRLAAQREAEAEASRHWQELRVSSAADQQRHESLRREQKTLVERLRDLRQTRNSQRQEIARNTAQVEEIEAETATLVRDIGSISAEIATFQTEIAKLESLGRDLRQGVATYEASLRDLRAQSESLRDQVASTDIRLAETKVRRQNLIDAHAERHAQDLTEFQPDAEALRQTVDALRDPADLPPPPDSPDFLALLETLLADTRSRLDAIGPVNQEAIAEYTELRDRDNFLESQRADLVNARKELLAIIEEINQTTEKLFAETFVAVKKNFGEMFRELFGGGAADLILLDTGNPLESGIEITARPPGKQPQSISLLSGGEKTMTAVALLFAIYMVKPSPFCVLDEMDAPLDESNITRFLGLLDRFVTQSQFLVITHNKRTMARADTLYGVTMEQRGVSRLVSVSFA